MGVCAAGLGSCYRARICLRLGVIMQSPGATGGSSAGVSPRALSPQLQFSEVLVKWRRFFHQMAAEQGQAGRAVLEMKLEAKKLQVMSKGGGCAAGVALLEVAAGCRGPRAALTWDTSKPGAVRPL